MSSPQIPTSKSRQEPTVEWPTFAVIIICYGVWFAAGMLLYPNIPMLALIIMTVMAALHSSLQHEALHGHPTRNAAFNELLVSLPLAGVFPYRRFKSLHLRHHCDERLTDPYDDPESWYLSENDLHNKSIFMQSLLRLNTTFLGRIIVGPPLMVVSFLASEWALLVAGSRDVRRAWFHHILGVVALCFLLNNMGIPLLLYVAVVSYGSLSLIAIRTYCEHRWHEQADSRTLIVERGGLLGLLFLNNHLHYVHHQLPRLPWYRLPYVYHAERSLWHQRNGGYIMANYWSIIWKFAFSAKEPVAHPVWRKGLGETNAASGQFALAEPALSSLSIAPQPAPAKPQDQ